MLPSIYVFRMCLCTIMYLIVMQEKVNLNTKLRVSQLVSSIVKIEVNVNKSSAKEEVKYRKGIHLLGKFKYYLYLQIYVYRYKLSIL